MALLNAFGKVIEESGGPYVLNECEVLAKGSISSVCKGKNYKRAKHMDIIINSTANADISKKHENRFFLITLKIFYIWALNFPHVY